jgi:hypothetical protein
MVAAAPYLVERLLRERAPMRGRVDRERGVIHDCKIVGTRSPNTHGVQGATGTDYTAEALAGELHLVEGINVNVDHPPRARPGQERSARDRFAWLEHCYVTADGIFGDLHFLDPTDPLAVKMMNAAELREGAGYALSHNAVGRGEVKDGRYVVVEVPEVHSVDIVADGGTNRTLFEGRDMARTTLRRLIEASRAAPALRRRLLELGEAGGAAAMMDQDMEAPAAAADEDGDWKADLVAAVGKLVSAGDPAKHKLGLKIMKLLKPEEGEEEADTEEQEEEEPAGGDEEEGPPRKKAKEGRQRSGPGAAGLRPGEVVLTEGRALALCKSAGIEATQDVVDAMKGVTFDQALAVLALAKRASAAPRPSSAPRSSGRAAAVQEGAAPAASDAKGWAQRLLG